MNLTLGERLARFREYIHITGLTEIARRYSVMNAFDGTLTILGVVIGAFVGRELDPTLIISAGVAGSMALGISGVSSAFVTEKAERARDLKDLESAMLVDLADTRHGRATRFAYYFAAAVSGLSPALAGMFILSPFFFAAANLITIQIAFYSCLVLTLLTLLLLGVYLARISEESMFRFGVQMIAVGIITMLLTSAVATYIAAPA